MEIRCRCSACQAKFKVDAKYAGKKARCPKCQQVVEVPLHSIEESTQTSIPPMGPAQPSAAGPGVSNSALVPPRATPGPAQSATFPKPARAAAPLPAGPPPAAADPLPNLDFTASARPALAGTPGSAAGQPALVQGRKSNLLPLIVGGGLAALLLVGIGIVAVIAMSGPSGGGKAPGKGATAGSGAASETMLVLNWPSDERREAALSIDGRREPLSASGELKFFLSPGEHRILLQRRGFEPIDEAITLAKGESEQFTPAWTAAGIAAAQPPIGPATSVPTGPRPPGTAISSSGNTAGGSAFPIGTAVESLAPRGFEGWLQSLQAAGSKAASEKKEVLMIFACSDGSPATRELVQVLRRSDTKTAIEARFVPVVIDFPRTSEGYNLVEDTGQNKHLQDMYNIREVPVLVLLDEQTRPYFVQRQWDDGFGGVLDVINSNQGKRAERDRLLEAASAGDATQQLAAAEAAIEWLTDQKLVRHYPQQRAAWMNMARGADPENAAGKLEKFLEPDWLIRLSEAGQRDDEAGVLAALRDLDPWLTRKFVDPDRGARIHMVAAQVLLAAERHDDASRHMERAVSYEPKDKDLREALAAVKLALQNKDLLGSGTGFLISSAGYVLTNHHVIEGEGRVEIRIPGTKDSVPAEIIAQDSDRDMALLKVAMPDPGKYTPICVVADPIRRGGAVAAFGYPLGDVLGTGLKFTDGSVSALPDPSNEEMYLLDLTVNPGNSGGPLCDRRGNVVGMITAKTGNFGFEDSYALAVPAADLLKFLDQHLPPGTPRAVAPAEAGALDWDQVDAKVSGGVLMILKKK